MEFVVPGEQKDLPPNSLLQIRVGSRQRTCALREGLTVILPAPEANETCTLQVLEIAGTVDVGRDSEPVTVKTAKGSVQVQPKVHTAPMPKSELERKEAVRSNEEAKRKEYMEEHHLQDMFSTLLRACLNYMPHNPEAFLVDYLRRRDPTTAQEVHISDRLEAIQTELNSIRNEGKMSFDEKGGLKRELSKRNQMNAKLERALGTAKDELDTLQLQLRDKKQMMQTKEGDRARQLEAEARDAMARLREQGEELERARSELSGLKSEGGALQEAESTAQELGETKVRLEQFEERVSKLEELLSDASSKMSRAEAEATREAERAATMAAELDLLGKLRDAATVFVGTATEVGIKSPRK